eukprot:TRINITY_DN1772_c4_g1_i1.p2 TRINITY_DN1772_c4_g1~~TRINITY_DN1772_c4_g1_i1.p2  ORF type:complete len:100 (+),score=18.09 TRINITY_DN1772_c4_g1_i1:166-465(+)
MPEDVLSVKIATPEFEGDYGSEATPPKDVTPQFLNMDLCGIDMIPPMAPRLGPSNDQGGDLSDTEWCPGPVERVEIAVLPPSCSKYKNSGSYCPVLLPR